MKLKKLPTKYNLNQRGVQVNNSLCMVYDPDIGNMVVNWVNAIGFRLIGSGQSGFLIDYKSTLLRFGLVGLQLE